MNELTIEEKAKRYDEAIERGKQIQNTPYTAHWDIMKEVAEDLLPELKESEDERIRKAIIEGFERYNSGALFNGVLVKEILAWLKKYVEQKISFSLPTEGEFPYNNPADTLDGEIENIWEKLSCDNKFTATKDGFHEVVVHFVNWYEKQGEQPKVDSTVHSYVTPNLEFFQWIYDRLVYVHHKNPDVDYMRSLKERIEDMQNTI